MGVGRTGVALAIGLFVLGAATAWAAEDWPQSKFDGRRCGGVQPSLHVGVAVLAWCLRC